MQQKIDHNVVLYDWLSFTTKDFTPLGLIDFLGLDHCTWTSMPGARGYKDRLYFGSISIHFNGRDDMGVWCEMSGQGCRSFEDFTTLPNKWDDLISDLLYMGMHVTRLDVAFDDHTGLLDINRIAADTEQQHFVSRMNSWQCTRSNKGTSVQIGSPQSKVLVRIYDKAAERGFEEADQVHWVRVELQLRDDRASEFLKIPMSIGESFAGVLLNYLRYVEPDDSDTNKSRWVMTDYWAALCDGVSKIRIYVTPGGEYNAEKLHHYVFDMAGNAIDCALELCGGDISRFMGYLTQRSCKPNPKYEVLKRQYYDYLENIAADAAQWFPVEDDPIPEFLPGYIAPSPEPIYENLTLFSE
ncbi:MAG: replication initiation factor domain-containing protein [Oscillospiraceae bacterium]|nr:replication initiation factor domain-containing protein [Oscillospiraceae bacterium]